MRLLPIKITIVSLAAFLLLGTGNLVNGVPYRQTSDNRPSAFVLAGYYPNWRIVVPQPNQKIKHQQTSGTKTSLSPNSQASQNWAGYIATPSSSGNRYTSVSGNWVVPNLSGGQQNSAAAQWIGLGGVSTTDLLQIGTIEQFENGQPTVEVFWENLPNSAQEIMNIPTGSTITASIAKSSSSSATDSSSTWDLTFSATTPDGATQSKTITVTLDPAYAQEIGSSAEWISEDPSNQYDQLYPLANMGTVNYKSATVNGQPFNSSANKVQPVVLVDRNGDILIAPSSIGTDGESFSTEVAGASGTNTNTNINTNTNTDTNTRTVPGYPQFPFPGSQWSHTWSSQGFGEMGGTRGWQWVIEISW